MTGGGLAATRGRSPSSASPESDLSTVGSPRRGLSTTPEPASPVRGPLASDDGGASGAPLVGTILREEG